MKTAIVLHWTRKDETDERLEDGKSQGRAECLGSSIPPPATEQTPEQAHLCFPPSDHLCLWVHEFKEFGVSGQEIQLGVAMSTSFLYSCALVAVSGFLPFSVACFEPPA